MLDSPDETLQFDWKIRAERYVAFLDIMGYKNMISTWEHSKLYSLMAELGDAVQTSDEATRISRFESGGKQIEMKAQLARSAFFSDSILIISRDVESDSFFGLLFGVLKAIFTLFRSGVPYRGGIGRGTIVADFERSIFFGQPIVDAYLLEESLNWYGVALPANSFEGLCETDEEKPNGWVALTYHRTVSTKQGPQELQIINWPAFVNNEQKIKELLEPFQNTHSDKLNSYYQNTLDLALSGFREAYPNGR